MLLLDIKNLTIERHTSDGMIKALDKVNLQIKQGELHALVGEAGSGKSLIVKAIVGALGDEWNVIADRMQWKNQDLLSLTPTQRRAITRRDIAVIFQDPLVCFDPRMTIEKQLKEIIPNNAVSHLSLLKRNAAKKRLVRRQLHQVGIIEHDFCLKRYPHQLTDDIAQKVMIAMALLSNPTLLIADDPTMGMETTFKSQILKLFIKLNKTKSLAIVLVSHDLIAITNMADTMTVLYSGQTVESGRTVSIKKRPLHPYTQALLANAPSFRKDLPRKSMLPSMKGSIPTLQHLPIGCRFGPRCERARKECVKSPSVRKIHEHSYSCHFPLHMEKI